MPQQRTGSGTPSATDFLLHDMPAIIDRLAEDYDGVTLPVEDEAWLRMLILRGSLVELIVVYVMLGDDGGVEIVSLVLDE